VKTSRKVLLYVLISVVGSSLLLLVSLTLWRSWQRHLPNEQTARQEFTAHAGEYGRFVSLLRLAPEDQLIGSDGIVRDRRGASRFVPEYRDLMQTIGAKFVVVRDDGSVEFALWGFGCAICSDSYMGVRYLSAQHERQANAGWKAQLVGSLDDQSLPHENGSVADGLYVVQIDPEWSLYRLELRN
jgi:hypothetical protein